jgi:hypothetical protein
VDLDERNIDAVRVFMVVRSQFKTVGANGYPISVDVMAVKTVIDFFKIKEAEQVFSMVVNVINGHFIKKIQKAVNGK